MKKVYPDLERLRGAMKRGDIQRLADQLGIHNSSVSNKLQGHVKFTFDDLNTYATFLNRDATDFLIIKTE